MAVENDKRARWLGIPGIVLGICICLTVISGCYIFAKGGRTEQRLDTVERLVRELIHAKPSGNAP